MDSTWIAGDEFINGAEEGSKKRLGRHEGLGNGLVPHRESGEKDKTLVL